MNKETRQLHAIRLASQRLIKSALSGGTISLELLRLKTALDKYKKGEV